MRHALATIYRTNGLLALSLLSCAAAPATAQQQLIELRVYHLRSAEKAELFDHTAETAFMPALVRQQVGPVGVFEPAPDAAQDDQILRYVVIPHRSSEAFVQLSQALAQDERLRADAEPYLSADKSDPVYTRVESSLLLAFSGMPELKIPKKRASSGRRLFELRIYESHSERKGKLKVDMFNSGEIEIFNEVGLNAVFFGEALVGKNLPNLTYMLVHEDQQALAQAWQKFLAHPDWERMKALPKYQDTVSKIIKQMLVPTEYSQIQ